MMTFEEVSHVSFHLFCYLLLLSPTCSAIKARGISSALIEVNNAKGSTHAVVTSSIPLLLWCQAVDDAGRLLPLNNASFRSKTQTYSAIISGDKRNASVTIDNVVASEAGKWHCDLQSDYGNATGIINVNVRPVMQHNPNVRVDEKDGEMFHVEISGTTVTAGDSAELHCPVIAHPLPTYSWKKDGKRVPNDSAVLKISQVSQNDDAIYTCIASNSIASNGTPNPYSLIVDQHLRVKNKLAWLAPFSVIVVTLILLIVTIVFCECRKRNNAQSQKITEDD